MAPMATGFSVATPAAGGYFAERAKAIVIAAVQVDTFQNEKFQKAIKQHVVDAMEGRVKMGSGL